MLLGLPFVAKPVLAIGGGGLALLAGVILSRLSEKIRWPHYFCLFLLLLLLSVGAGIYFFDRPLTILYATGKLALICTEALFLVTAAQQMPLPNNKWLLLLPVGAVIATAHLLMLHLSYPLLREVLFDGAARGPHIFNKPAGALTLLLPALFVLVSASTRNARLWISLIYLLSVFAVLFSESQSSLLALIIIPLAFFAPVRQPLFWNILRFTLVGGVLAAPWLAIYIFSFAGDIKAITWLASASIPQRFEVWNAFAQEILLHPLLGQGYDAAQHIPRLDIQEIYQRGIAFTHPHNMALQIWLEFGVIGAVLASSLIFILLRLFEQEPDIRIRRLYLGSFLPLFCVAQISWGMWQIWWVVLVILVATLTIIAARALRSTATESSTSRAIS